MGKVALRNGSEVTIKIVGADDEMVILDFIVELTPMIERLYKDMGANNAKPHSIVIVASKILRENWPVLRPLTTELISAVTDLSAEESESLAFADRITLLKAAWKELDLGNVLAPLSAG